MSLVLEKREYQDQAVAHSLDFLMQKKKRNGIVIMPCGAGKSIVAARIVLGLDGPQLPGVTTGERRSPEIEEAAERWEDTKLAKAKAVKAHQDADDILVTVMRKKKRTHYSRSTFGVVSVPEPKIRAKFAREKQESLKPKSRKRI